MSVTAEKRLQRVALLDTSIQVDRAKAGARRAHVENMLREFDLTVSTSISLLEFKATVIQECITIHNALRRDGRFTAVRDSLIESLHRQHRLRAHIFNNLLNAFSGSSFTITDDADRRLAEKARLHLEDQIPRLYKWFRYKSVDAILFERIKCTRADEPPTRKKVAFATNLPICKRGKNKHCSVEEFIRETATPLAADLRSRASVSEQLERSIEIFESVGDDPNADISHAQCRAAGDCLIALEAREHATHALSTNASEWELLSQPIGFEFVKVDYPK